MVLYWLLDAGSSALVALFSILPDADIDTTGWADSARSIFEGIGAADGWLPMDELFFGLGVLIAARFAVTGYRILRSMWDALPLT